MTPELAKANAIASLEKALADLKADRREQEMSNGRFYIQGRHKWFDSQVALINRQIAQLQTVLTDANAD